MDPTKRFASMRALGRALLPFASELTRANHQGIFEPTAEVTLSDPPKASRHAADEPVSDAGQHSTLGGAVSVLDRSPRGRDDHPRPLRRRFARWAGASAVTLTLAAWTAHHVAHRDDAVPPDFAVELRTQPPDARIEVDGVAVGAGSFRRRFSRDGRPHHVVVSAEGYATQQADFTNTPPDAVMTLQPSRPAVVGVTPHADPVHPAPMPDPAQPLRPDGAGTPAPVERPRTVHPPRQPARVHNPPADRPGVY